ncbi:MAG: biotin transporter BioY [Peptococcaceae bacterium]|jgi:biotin transport system substrate-specific component|nr:biotin transporter BioY [Peptococcaceae bacterium]
MAGTNENTLRKFVYAAMFAALTAIGAYIVIPFQPVPITLQNLFTFLAAVLLGGKWGALSQLIYVLLGIIGLPVFAGGKAGLGTLFGPTGGYIIGFVIGAYVLGKIAELRRRKGTLWILLAIVAGEIVIYTVGTLWLSFVSHISLSKALLLGVVPFIIGDLLKILITLYLAPRLSKYMKL